jgi:hypothetical protein
MREIVGMKRERERGNRQVGGRERWRNDARREKEVEVDGRIESWLVG